MSMFTMWLWLGFWACKIRQKSFEVIIVVWLEFGEHRKLPCSVSSKRSACAYRHVQFSMCTKLKPQLHSEVLISRGWSLVGVDVHNVAVARVLGMRDSANKLS